MFRWRVPEIAKKKLCKFSREGEHDYCRANECTAWKTSKRSKPKFIKWGEERRYFGRPSDVKEPAFKPKGIPDNYIWTVYWKRINDYAYGVEVYGWKQPEEDFRAEVKGKCGASLKKFS